MVGCLKGLSIDLAGLYVYSGTDFHAASDGMSRAEAKEPHAAGR